MANNNILTASTHPKLQHKLIGHEAILQELLELYNNNKLHHAYMFRGSKGIGKATLAYYLAKTILANQKPITLDNTALFNSEDPNLKLIYSGTHPNLLVIEPSFDEANGKVKNIITIDKIREIKDFLNLTSLTSNKLKIIIIDSIDSFNLNAANAILKILEEPTSSCLFLIINHNANNILPTINSRCIIKKVGALSSQQIIEVTQNLNQEQDNSLQELEEYSNFFEGSIDHMLWFLEPTHKKLFNLCSTIIKNKTTTSINEVGELAKALNFNDFQYLLHIIIYKLAPQSTNNNNSLANQYYEFNEILNSSKTLNLDQNSILISLLLAIVTAA